MRYGKTESSRAEHPLIFTGDAIAQLVPGQPIDLDEWQYHEQSIGGTKYHVVTHKLTFDERLIVA